TETSKADRVGFKVEDGKKIRVFKSTQKQVQA
ncbi:50S ribosomal protein L24, partial [Pseudomonas aeruginosa]|nr:50S ribosomal protein L24 [Pseudomonas aeruginosa]